MLINKLYNYDVYKYYERAKIALLVKCLTPLKSNFTTKNPYPTESTNHIARNISNIATLAERNRTSNSDQQVLEFGSGSKGSYSIDRELLVLKRDNTAEVEVDEEDEDDELDEDKEDANEMVFDENCRRFERGEDVDYDDEDDDQLEGDDVVGSRIVNSIRT